MSCCAGCDSGMGCMSHLMGAIEQNLAPIGGGTPFQFGFNIGYTLNPFSAADIAPVLENAALSYDTHSYVVAGYLNPFVTIEGNAVTSWESASDFGEAIYQAVSGAGFPIDYPSIKFRAFPEAGSAPAQTRVIVGDQYQTPGARSPSVPQAPGGGCNFTTQNLPDYLACQLGVTPTVALVAGAIGALILIVAIKR
jgi:hypothetical protein